MNQFLNQWDFSCLTENTIIYQFMTAAIYFTHDFMSLQFGMDWAILMLVSSIYLQSSVNHLRDSPFQGLKNYQLISWTSLPVWRRLVSPQFTYPSVLSWLLTVTYDSFTWTRTLCNFLHSRNVHRVIGKSKTSKSRNYKLFFMNKLGTVTAAVLLSPISQNKSET